MAEALVDFMCSLPDELETEDRTAENVMNEEILSDAEDSLALITFVSGES